MLTSTICMRSEFSTKDFSLSEKLTRLKSDIDGNIERCHLRIRENILPKLFQERLERYMRQKAEREYVQPQPISRDQIKY